MKTLIATLSLVATITLTNADYPKPNYQAVVDISDINPYARLDAWKAYRADRRAQISRRSAETKAKTEVKRQEAKTSTSSFVKNPKSSAESLFAQKMAERHGTK
jgi:hypothetical protein